MAKRGSPEEAERLRNLRKQYDLEHGHNPAWKGGKILRTGYYYIKSFNHPFAGKQKYVAEHRLVMEKHLGRYLKFDEAVHHINGNRIDNRIENLEVYETHGQHTKHAHKDLYERQKIEFKGKHFSPKTEFKKGMASWNKGLKKT